MRAASTGNSLARRDLTRFYAAAVSAVAPAHLIGRTLGGESEGSKIVQARIAEAPKLFATLAAT